MLFSNSHFYVGNHLEGRKCNSTIRSSWPWRCRRGGDIWEENRVQNRRKHRQNLEPTWSRVGDPDHGGVTLFLQRVLWLRGSLGADNYPGPVSIRVNCIRLLVNWHHQCQRWRLTKVFYLVSDHDSIRWGVGLAPGWSVDHVAEAGVAARAGLRLLRLARRYRGLLTKVPWFKLWHLALQNLPLILMALTASSLRSFRRQRGSMALLWIGHVRARYGGTTLAGSIPWVVEDKPSGRSRYKAYKWRHSLKSSRTILYGREYFCHHQIKVR